MGSAPGRADLIAFAHVVKRPEERLDLAQAALLIAEPFQKSTDQVIDLAYYVGRIDRLADEARRRVAGLPPGPVGGEVRARRLLRLLYEEVGFAGNGADYYDPRNSYLNEVLDRRLGIPITLAIVVMEVARRAGMEAEGIGFPGHFLVRMPGPEGPLLIDPFIGRLLDPEALRTLHGRATGDDSDPDPRLLAPIKKRQILVRMLSNLRAIFRSRGDVKPLRLVLERLSVLAPEDEEVRSALSALEDEEEPNGSGRPMN